MVRGKAVTAQNVFPGILCAVGKRGSFRSKLVRNSEKQLLLQIIPPECREMRTLQEEGKDE